MKLVRAFEFFWWFSPLSLSIFSGSVVLFAFLFPSDLYMDMVGEYNFAFMNVHMLSYSLLCILAFMFGIKMFTSAFQVKAKKETQQENLHQNLYLAVQTFMTKWTAFIMFIIHVCTLFLLIMNIPPEFIFRAITGQENSSFLMLMVTDVLGKYNVVNIIAIGKFLAPWIFYVYFKSQHELSHYFNLAYFKLFIHLYLWSLLVILLLLQNRGPLLSLIFSIILVWILVNWQYQKLDMKKILIKGSPIILFAIVYFAIIQITRSGGFEGVEDPSKLFFSDLIGYFLGSYNRLAAFLDGHLYFPGEGTGYYWTRWFWEFPLVSSLLQLQEAVKDFFAVLPPSGFQDRYMYMEAAGLNSRYTAITIFAHSLIDFGWLGFLPFIFYGFLSAGLWKLFQFGTIIGVILYPYISWSILEWRGYIEITRPETGLIMIIAIMIWLFAQILTGIYLKSCVKAHCDT